MEPFIPSQDPQALLWMQNFANKLTADPGKYMVTAADAVTVTNAVQLFADALSDIADPDQRTKPKIVVKDSTRNSAEAVCRQFAILIKYNAGISDEDKVSIGVRPVNPDREPIECPATSPLINVVASTPGSQTLRYADSMTPDSRAKPFGASELQLFMVVAEEDSNDPSQARFVGKFTKNPISVEFTAADNGKQATYFARWASRRGQVGPWSLPISMAIAA